MRGNNNPIPADTATTTPGRHREGPDRVSVGCLIKVIPSKPGLPRVHHRHDERPGAVHVGCLINVRHAQAVAS